MWVLAMEPESSGRASSVVGESFALFPRTVNNKLNLDSGDGVHAQLTRINHRGFVADSDGERGTHGGRRRGLEVSWALLDLGKAELGFSPSLCGSAGFISYYLTPKFLLTIE